MTVSDAVSQTARSATSLAVADEDALRVLIDTLAYSRAREYVGPDYADGMSSRLLRALPFENRWLNLAVQETIKRAPIDLRPLFLVEQRRNFKGAALFAMANLTVDRLGDADLVTVPDGVAYADEATDLLDWLLQHRCKGYSGFCGSHQHEIQLLEKKGVPTNPSIVSTAFPVRAFLAAADRDPVYPAVARTAADFVVEDLAYREVEDGAVISYLPTDSGEYVTPNAIALGAGLFVDLYEHTGDEALADRSRRLLDFLAANQAADGGWPYRIPDTSTHLSKDSFHNGYILEAFLRYRSAVETTRYDDVLDHARSFYGGLFEPDGAPHWDESSAYPRDVHAAAQGIIVHALTGEFEVASRILDWTLEHLYAGDGRFYFRAHRFYTKRITLMRWCQAWMAYALAVYLSRRLDG